MSSCKVLVSDWLPSDTIVISPDLHKYFKEGYSVEADVKELEDKFGLVASIIRKNAKEVVCS